MAIVSAREVRWLELNVLAALLVAGIITTSSAQLCRGTGSKPSKTLGITFCEQYTDNACCTPALDAENEEMFKNLVNVGPSCRLRGDLRKHPMARFYCLNCDPEEPNFVVGTNVYICRSWVDSVFGTGSDTFKPHRMNDCGFYVASPCEGKDRYMCGDDLLIPSTTAVGNDGVSVVKTVQELLNFQNIGPPLYEDGYTFVIVNDTSLAKNNITACFSHAASVGPVLPFLLVVLLLSLIQLVIL